MSPVKCNGSHVAFGGNENELQTSLQILEPSSQHTIKKGRKNQSPFVYKKVQKYFQVDTEKSQAVSRCYNFCQ